MRTAHLLSPLLAPQSRASRQTSRLRPRPRLTSGMPTHLSSSMVELGVFGKTSPALVDMHVNRCRYANMQLDLLTHEKLHDEQNGDRY